MPTEKSSPHDAEELAADEVADQQRRHEDGRSARRRSAVCGPRACRVSPGCFRLSNATWPASVRARCRARARHLHRRRRGRRAPARSGAGGARAGAVAAAGARAARHRRRVRRRAAGQGRRAAGARGRGDRGRHGRRAGAGHAEDRARGARRRTSARCRPTPSCSRTTTSWSSTSRPGLLTAPTPESDRNNLADRCWRGGRARARAFVVHRIDLETSGLMVFAKTAARQPRALASGFATHDLERAYLAVVIGRFPDELTLIDQAGRRAPRGHARRGPRAVRRRARRWSPVASRPDARTRSGCTCSRSDTR